MLEAETRIMIYNGRIEYQVVMTFQSKFDPVIEAIIGGH